ncbi:MAG TPA: hypothetical protein VEG65_01385 [Candidatus Bathyarchaeia archaeon]|nr:hypothetical protein [Candidatus Bathyarchaeia archaeon]
MKADKKRSSQNMRRLALSALSLGSVFIVLVAFAPLTASAAFAPHQPTIAQLNEGGNIFDQINSLYNNLTKRFNVNPPSPQQTVTPSVKITGVQTAPTGQSVMTPHVIVTLQNGQVALDGVRIDIVYKNAGGTDVGSDSSVVALKADETRSVTFSPTGLSAGSYTIGVVAYKNGTDPSNQATPPYDTQQNAATLTIASPTASPTAAGGSAGKAGDAAGQNSAADALTHLNSWLYFVIAITGLITIALFFVFSQNRSGDDRYAEEHFKGDFPAGGSGEFGHLVPGNASLPLDRSRDDMAGAASSRLPSRRIEVTAAEVAPSDQMGTPQNSASIEDAPQFETDGFVVGDVTSKKALRNKIRGKRGA